MDCSIEEYIKCHLIDKYELLYNKTMEVTVDGEFYSLFMELNNADRPLMIGGEFETDLDFAKYVVKEIDRREIFKTKYFIIQATDELNRT